MALDIDTTRALRGSDALIELVRAVVAADDHDETEPLEWKSTLDLSSKHGCFHVARAILGLANRDPQRSLAAFEGYGYVVVGAEPGNLAGISPVDPSDYTGTIAGYVGGARGPAWTPVHVGVDGERIAIFVVEPPSPGDPSWPLRKEFSPHQKGRVFVRKAGMTEPADDDDIDMLSARASARAAELEPKVTVDVVGHLPLPWLEADTLSEAVDRWTAEWKSSLVRSAEDVDRRRNPPAEDVVDSPLTDVEAKAAGIDMTGIRGAIGAFDAFRRQQERIHAVMRVSPQTWAHPLAKRDERTLDDYLTELEEWSATLRSRAADGFVGMYVAQGYGAIQLKVTNLSTRFMTDVQVNVRFPWHRARAVDHEPDYKRLPEPPHPFGQPRAREDFLGYLGSQPVWTPPSFDVAEGIGRRTWVDDGSINVTFELGTLRPKHDDLSDTIWILLPGRPEGGAIEGTWDVTAEHVHTVIAGRLSVPVADEPVEATTVLDAEFSDSET